MSPKKPPKKPPRSHRIRHRRRRLPRSPPLITTLPGSPCNAIVVLDAAPRTPAGSNSNLLSPRMARATSASSRLPAALSARPATPTEALSPPFSTEAMSKANKLKANKLNNKVALTRRIQVEYLRPVPLAQPLVVHGRVSRMSGRVLYNRAELRNATGRLLARARGTFLTVNAEQMFARELENERRNSP